MEEEVKALNLNEKMIADIADQLGLQDNPGISAGELRQLESKSDEQLTAEILRMRDQLAAKGIPYGQQAAMLRSLMQMMDSKQRARLQKIIELIER